MGRASRRKEEREKRKEERKKAASSPGTLPPPPQPLLTRPLSVLILLSLLATATYSNTFSSSFHFDDFPNIVENPKIKHLENFLDLSGSRYVGFLAFALNYHFGGLHVFGYHLINLLIHITNGFLVYTLVLLLFRASRIHHPASIISPLSPWVALATALLFIAHPLQTQAVTYIVQRFASLAALFYLLAVVCYLKWRLSRIVTSSEGQGAREASLPATRYSLLWYAAALLSTILAMKTKENSFTLPFMILLVEAVFFRPIRRKQWASLIPFLLTLPIIPLSISGAIGEGEAGLAQETTEISRGDYLLTQFRVIVTYLRLLVFPAHQNMDYDYPIYHSLFDPPVFFSFLLLGSLFALAVYFLLRSQLSTLNFQLIAFGLLWFFLTLSVESSIIPIRDVIFEHRLYLPSVGFFMTLSVMLGRSGVQRHRVLPAWGMAVLCVAITLFSMATYQRNQIWQDEVTLWEDVVRRSPNKVRGHNNLGVAYKDAGRLEEAFREYQSALRLQPNHAEAHNNIGNAYLDQGRLEEAFREYQTALQLQPGYAQAHYNLGNAYRDQGRLEEAVREYQTALRLQPDYAEAHNNLGVAFATQGRLEQAIQEYHTALKLRPDYAEAHNNLGIAYAAQGRFDEAIQIYRKALLLKTDLDKTHVNLGHAYVKRGRLRDAIAEYQAAVMLKPDDPNYHYILANVYEDSGRLDDALREYQAALKLKPDFADAQYGLGNAYAGQQRMEEAKEAYQKVLTFKPDYAEAHNNLGNVYTTQGRLAEAVQEYQRAIALKPDYAQAHNNLGHAYRRQGRIREAKEEFEHAQRAPASE